MRVVQARRQESPLIAGFVHKHATTLGDVKRVRETQRQNCSKAASTYGARADSSFGTKSSGSTVSVTVCCGCGCTLRSRTWIVCVRRLRRPLAERPDRAGGDGRHSAYPCTARSTAPRPKNPHAAPADYRTSTLLSYGGPRTQSRIAAQPAWVASGLPFELPLLVARLGICWAGSAFHLS